MTRECHVRFCKRLGAKLLRPTYQRAKSYGIGRKCLLLLDCEIPSNRYIWHVSANTLFM